MENNWIEFDRYHHYIKLDDLYVITWKDEVSVSILITSTPGSLQTFYMKNYEIDVGNKYPGWNKHLIHLIFTEKLYEYSKNDTLIRIFDKYFKL